MRILNTKCFVAVLVIFAMLAIDSCSLSLNAGLKGNSVPRPPGNGDLQARALQAGQEISESAIFVEAALVNLDVLVTDQDGRVLSGLNSQNFRILDNGNPQVIAHFERRDAEPITIAVLMEYSGVGYNHFAYKAAYWGSRFLDHLEPLDWVALVTYDIKPTVQQDFTRNKAQAQQTLSTLSYPQFREANMYDAIIDTLDRLDRVKGKKAVVPDDIPQQLLDKSEFRAISHAMEGRT